MDNKEKALLCHKEWNGKLETVAKSKVKTREDLAIAYTPGVAEPCKVIAEDKTAAYTYTWKANTVAVVSDGSAVLGLGNIGPYAAMPVMEGKCVLFKEFGNVNAVPICLDTQDTEEIIQAVKNIAPGFGGINLEDISAPRCFEIEERLKEMLDIPVFHDDQHGTAIVVLAGIINGLRVTGKKKEDCRVVVNGAGSAGVAITKLLLTYGFKHVTMCDREGIIGKDYPNLNWMQKKMTEVTNLENASGTLADALRGADNSQVVMAAIDSTQRPEIYVNGSRLQAADGRYSFTAGGVGEHQFSGYILMKGKEGEEIRRNFSQKYTVLPVPNSATVAADLMNVLYAGYANPISISVPGVPANAISASMSGGSFVSKGNGHFVATPSTVGRDVTIHVTARDKGQVRSLPPFVFHVRKLPDPTAYIAIGTDRFRGGGLAKANLMGATGIHAAIDDGLLDIPFKVVGFETVFFDNMGNAIPLASAGASFSARQREEFRKLYRNRRFYISHIRAVGPDGIMRTLPSAMEVIVK